MYVIRNRITLECKQVVGLAPNYLRLLHSFSVFILARANLFHIYPSNRLLLLKLKHIPFIYIHGDRILRPGIAFPRHALLLPSYVSS